MTKNFLVGCRKVRNAKNAKKYLQSRGEHGIIIERDCTRYAMKREVAATWQGISAEYVRF